MLVLYWMLNFGLHLRRFDGAPWVVQGERCRSHMPDKTATRLAKKRADGLNAESVTHEDRREIERSEIKLTSSTPKASRPYEHLPSLPPHTRPVLICSFGASCPVSPLLAIAAARLDTVQWQRR